MSDQVVYAVAPGKSIVTGTDKLLKENTVLPHQDEERLTRLGLTLEDIEKFKKKGRVVKVILDDATGLIEAPMRDAKQTAAVLPGNPTGAGQVIDPNASGPAKAAPTGQAPGRWGYDPASLVNMDLAALNGLIVQIDATVEPFSTPEEAAAFLSQDFVAQQSAASQDGDQVAQA